MPPHSRIATFLRTTKPLLLPILAWTALAVLAVERVSGTSVATARAEEAAKCIDLLASTEERHERELEVMRLRHEAEVSVLKSRCSPQLDSGPEIGGNGAAASIMSHKQVRTAPVTASRTLLEEAESSAQESVASTLQQDKCTVDEMAGLIPLGPAAQVDYVTLLLTTHFGCGVCVLAWSAKPPEQRLFSSLLDCVEPSCDPSSAAIQTPMMVSFSRTIRLLAAAAVQSKPRDDLPLGRAG